jgi:hypothetical protein
VDFVKLEQVIEDASELKDELVIFDTAIHEAYRRLQ